jgi:hypothetical protein
MSNSCFCEGEPNNPRFATNSSLRPSTFSFVASNQRLSVESPPLLTVTVDSYRILRPEVTSSNLKLIEIIIILKMY